MAIIFKYSMIINTPEHEQALISKYLEEFEEDQLVDELRQEYVAKKEAKVGGASLKVIRKKLCRLEKTFLRDGDLSLPQSKEELSRLQDYQELQELYSTMRHIASSNTVSGPVLHKLTPAFNSLYRSSVEALNLTVAQVKRQEQLHEQEGTLDDNIQDVQKQLKNLEKKIVQRQALSMVENAWLARLDG